MSAENTDPTDVGEAFAGLLDRLHRMAQVVEADAAGPVERAEGYRHLLRLLAACEEWMVEKSDGRRPVFTRVMTPWRKFIGDNPDTFYEVAPVVSGTSYRLRGRRNGAGYLGVTVYGRDAAGRIALLGQIADPDLVAADGSFDLRVGGPEAPQGAPWVPVPEGAESLWVRQYFHDVAGQEPASFTLEPTADPGPPLPLTPEVVAAGIDRVSSFMSDTFDAVTTLSRTMARRPNSPLMAGAEFGVDDQDGAPDASELEALLLELGRTSYPTPDNRYAGVWFELEPDQALVVTGRPPANAWYWGIQLANRWQESLDAVHFTVCLNDQQIELEPDGTYRVIVAAADPGGGNWLDTAGHRAGMVNVRALLADDLEDPAFEVVPVASLGAGG